jgi:Fic family protein
MTFESGKAPAETSEERELATIREAYMERLTRPGQPFALSGVFPLPSDLGALYQQLAQLKDCLDSFRPLDPAQSEKLREAFDTEYTYHSNKIEGNTLTLGETDLVINKGMTIAGKSLREHSEAINHLEAIDFIRDLVGRREDLTPHNLCQIHALIMHGIDRENAGRYRGVPVTITGSRHEPPQPYLVAKRMEELFTFYETNKDTMHPVQLAAETHEKLVTVHPFIDGNGRTSRLVMNLLLLRGGYPITINSGEAEQRLAYYRALEAAQISNDGDNREFQGFVGETVRRWLLRYLDLVSVDVTEHRKDKGLIFFRIIAPHLNGHAHS